MKTTIKICAIVSVVCSTLLLIFSIHYISNESLGTARSTGLWISSILDVLSIFAGCILYRSTATEKSTKAVFWNLIPIINSLMLFTEPYSYFIIITMLLAASILGCICCVIYSHAKSITNNMGDI